MQEWFQTLFSGWLGPIGSDIGLIVAIVVKIVAKM